MGLFCLLFCLVCALNLTAQQDGTTQYRKICEPRENGMFLYDIEVISDGCFIECIFLDSSSPKYIEYFDVTRFSTQNLFDGTRCGHNLLHRCFSGSCISIHGNKGNNTMTTMSTLAMTISEFGMAIITVKEAHVPKKDKTDETDTYVQVNLAENELGRTDVVNESSDPYFNKRFRTGKISVRTKVTLFVYDHDNYGDHDLIGSVVAEIDAVVSSGQSGKILTREIPEGWIRFKIDWYSDQHG